MAFQLIIGAFHEGAAIPELYTCDGANISPSLEWGGEPQQTRSFVLIVDDPDAPHGTWNHWLLYDLSASVHNLAQAHKEGSLGLSGTNDFGKPGYGGPCPPKGHGAHRYLFKLHAVNVASLGLAPGARRADLDKALKGHVLAVTQYMGRYERR